MLIVEVGFATGAPRRIVVSTADELVERIKAWLAEGTKPVSYALVDSVGKVVEAKGQGAVI